MSSSPRLRVSGYAALLVFMATCLGGSGSPLRGDSLGCPVSPPAVLPERPSIGREMALAALIQAGQLSDLRWPNFSDYWVYLTDFYQPLGCTLAWLKDGRPTPQAAAAIDALQNADIKGLDAEDYDGRRWAHRIASLQQPGPGQSETDTARFDLALTVSLMRFVSDLHMGRVNPRYFHSGFNIV